MCRDRNWIDARRGKAERWSSTVSQNPFWLSPDKRLLAHNSGIQERKQPDNSTCVLSEMKRKNNSVLTSSSATRSKYLQVLKNPVVLRSSQSHQCANRWAFKTSFFIDSITRQLFPSWSLPLPPCLTPPPPWLEVIIRSLLKLITSLALSECTR